MGGERGKRESRESGSEVYSFAGAAAAMSHRLGGLDNRKSSSHSSGGWECRSCEGRSTWCLFPSFRCFAGIFGIPGLWTLHPDLHMAFSPCACLCPNFPFL